MTGIWNFKSRHLDIKQSYAKLSAASPIQSLAAASSIISILEIGIARFYMAFEAQCDLKYFLLGIKDYYLKRMVWEQRAARSRCLFIFEVCLFRIFGPGIPPKGGGEWQFPQNAQVIFFSWLAPVVILFFNKLFNHWNFCNFLIIQ